LIDWQNVLFLLFMPLMLAVASAIFRATYKAMGAAGMQVSCVSCRVPSAVCRKRAVMLPASDQASEAKKPWSRKPPKVKNLNARTYVST